MKLLVPKLLFKDKVWPYIFFVLIMIVGSIAVNRLAESSLNLPELMERTFHPHAKPSQSKKSDHAFDFVLVIITMLMVGISTSVTVFQKLQRDTELRLSLEKEKTTSELSFLKAQINPHFFFNTLHSIYALTIANVELARDALYTLSHMMRYVLYETQSGTTLLSKEIAFIKDYIDLMQLRLTEKVKVTFISPSPLKDVQIAPMLILPFIENAFKHGVSAVEESKVYVEIKQQGNLLMIEVRNSLLSEKGGIMEESNGIGVNNTKRRLDLIYPGQYELKVTEDIAANEFVVQLNLNMA
ncbi:sensor histidine kinase [Rubrolithibacter danxiaensis]|uniref:sensor histidine kinase n=1 Tax=Rubrolithibacter danxiaensis TaxID=3390805 RepID=UPI003BF7C4CA